MADSCNLCPIRTGCDILSEFCRLKPREVVTLRPDLIRKRDRRPYWQKRYQDSKQPIRELNRKISEYIATGAHEDFVQGGYKTFIYEHSGKLSPKEVKAEVRSLHPVR